MADVLQLEFSSPDGDTLAVEWDAETLEALSAPAADGGPEWRLIGDIDWDRIEAMRLLYGRLGDGRSLAVAAIRPAGAAGHGDDVAGSVLETDTGLESAREVLISIEYDAAEQPRRVGVELWPEDEPTPWRLAADVRDIARLEDGAVHRLRAIVELRLDGERGDGVFEIVSAG